jgi:hypothetical protein
VFVTPAVLVFAQTVDPKQVAVDAAPPATVTPGVPEVESVVNLTKAAQKADMNGEVARDVDTKAGGDVTVQLKDALKIKLSNYTAWRVKNEKASLVLFLDGVELTNVVATPAARDSGDPEGTSALIVRLQPQDDKDGVVRKAWVQVLRAAMARRDRPLDQRKIDVSVGVLGTAPFVTKAQVALDVWPWYAPFVVGFFVVVAGLLLWLAVSSNILRDSSAATNPPFSLAKHQMALWFVVVIGGYLFIWLITGFFASISTTALTLIGISGATGLVAVVMDSNKRAETANTRAAQQAERDALDQTLNDPASGLLTQLNAAAPGSAAAVALTAQVTPKLARLNELTQVLGKPVPGTQQSVRWDKDLLSDENGISFHRFQMAIWTLALVLVFVRAVWTEILMPDFDTTLLGLMGISSGTYLGFKFPEKLT